MLSAARPLTSFAQSAPSPVTLAGVGDRFTPSLARGGDNLKGTLVLGAIGLVGGALGVYAGLNTGILAGLAGTVAGAAGGCTLATMARSQPIHLGLIGGAIGGALIGASVGNPFVAAAMGVAGATLPYAAMVALFSGVE
jgi:hypothetical protein